MPVGIYIDTSYFQPVYGNSLPDITSPSIEAICKELYFAVKTNEPIFVYGDYDMDGFAAGMVWEEVLSSLYTIPVHHFYYGQRMHTLDQDVLRQVKSSGAKYAIICDTGSTRQDRQVTALLRMNGVTTITIDHHSWEGDYSRETSGDLIFNSHEERNLLGGAEVSGAYASLLVAARLCKVYFRRSLSYNAMVYALASMYSDVVDLSTPVGRALYNVVALTKMRGPQLLDAMNSQKYRYSRRMFSFFVSPKVNACFRMEEFGPLNRAFTARDKYTISAIASEFDNLHTQAISRVNSFVPLFSRERFGDILLCIHEPTLETQMLRVRNFSGLIANKIAREEMCAVVTLVKTGTTYAGSFRDYYNRKMLDVFKLFCKADGHEQAFGVEVHSLQELRRHLSGLESQMETGVRKDYITLSSQLIASSDDVDTLALYNEYMNVQPKIMLNHRASYVRTMRSSKYGKLYDVGLPLTVRAKAPILPGAYVLLEPTISRDTELRSLD